MRGAEATMDRACRRRSCRARRRIQSPRLSRAPTPQSLTLQPRTGPFPARPERPKQRLRRWLRAPQSGRTAPVPHAAVPHAAPVNGNGHAPHPHDATDMNGGQRAGCTAPQLRRFIKSRPYVPMHELRRRFGINGAEDEVSALPLEDARVYVGLPERECRLLGELVRGGEVGYELSLDPRTPIVVGVYPMRPVPRA